MRRAAAAFALVALVFTARSSAQNAGGGAFVASEIIVRFRPGVTASAQADAHSQAGGRQVAEIARTRVQLVSVPAGDERGAIARYLRNPNVVVAEPNFVRRIDQQVVPNDSYFREQWALHNTGQLFYCIPWIDGQQLCFYVGTPDADIDAPEAWAISTGSSSVKVAVIDTGIDYTHPDLGANYAGGYDFVTPDADPMDDHGHGTHVSGTVAAAMNNLTGSPAEEEGAVGIAPQSRVLAYKVCDANGGCDDFAIQQAIARAIADGANVINNNVVSVGASDEDDLRASFSNYGSWVDIAAPGNVILSTYPMSGCSVSTTPGDIGCYAYNSGTSMATPHVAGAAALVWSRGDIGTASQVVDALLSSADGAGAGSVRPDSWTIHGRLNLYGAMTYLGGPPPPPNNPPTANAGADSSWTDTDGDGGVMVPLSGSGSDPDGDAITYQWLEHGTAIAAGAAPSVWLTVGVHTLTLRVTDARGASATDTVVVTVQAGAVQTLSVTGLSPNSVSQRAGTLDFVITGTGFASGATMAFANGSGQAPRVRSVTYNSATQLTARVEIRQGGPKTVRRWDVVVTNPGGATAVGVGLLTITP